MAAGKEPAPDDASRSSVSSGAAKKALTKAAGAVGLATLISRLLGFLRDMIIADFFGAKVTADAFFVAFRIPNLLRRLTAEGAMTAAFVPVYTELKEKRGKKEAFALGCNLLTILGALLIGATLIAEAFAPQIVSLIAPGFTHDPDTFALTTLLTRIMIPYLFLISITALLIGMLNSHGSFFTPALAPALLNIVMIVSALTLSDYFDEPAMALAVGVTVGGVAQLLMQLFPLAKHGFRYRPSFRLSDQATRRVGLLIIPGIFGMAVAEINVLVDTILASLLAEGSVSYLYYGNRVTQFPLGIFGVAVGIAALPTMSTHVAQGGKEGLADLVSHAMRLTLFISIPASVALILMAEPITNILFERGMFDETARIGTTIAIIYYSVGLVAFSGVKIFVSAFYALKDTSRPTRVAAWTMALNVLLNILLMEPLQHGGLALATSLSSFVNLLFLWWLLRKEIGPLPNLLRPLLTMLLSALLMGIAVWYYCTTFYSYDAPIELRLFHIGIMVFFGIVIYFVAMLLFGSGEATALKERFIKKLRRG